MMEARRRHLKVFMPPEFSGSVIPLYKDEENPDVMTIGTFWYRPREIYFARKAELNQQIYF